MTEFLPQVAADPTAGDELRLVPFDDLDIFAGQSRGLFDAADLANLAASIEQYGVLQPGVAYFDEGRGRLILVCGERRMRAAKLAGRTTMPVKVVRGKLSQADLLALNISENLQRADLNVVERAQSFRRMMQLGDLTAREVARRLQVSDALVSRDLAILDLPPALLERVASGALPATVAATLARTDDDEFRRFLADQFAARELTREGVTAAVNRRLKKPPRRDAGGRYAGKHDGVTFRFSLAAGELSPAVLLRTLDAIRAEVKAKQKATTPDAPAAVPVAGLDVA